MDKEKLMFKELGVPAFRKNKEDTDMFLIFVFSGWTSRFLGTFIHLRSIIATSIGRRLTRK